jgi:hypothetical protein
MEAKADAVSNIPFPTTLSQLEHFIGLTNWNRHLIPYYAASNVQNHAA